MNFTTISFLVSVLLLGTSVSAQCNKTLRVGFMTGLSGEGRVWGEAVKNGFELGLRDAGGAEMARIYEDDGFSPAKSVTAFHKLVNEDHANVIIVTSSATGNAVAPLAQKEGIALFAWASDRNVSRNRPLVVRTWRSGEDEGEVIAALARQENYKRVAAFSTIHDYTGSVWAGFTQNFPAAQVVAVNEFPSGVKDFRTQIAAARNKRTDALYACLMVPGDNGIFAKQARELGVDVPIFGCEALEMGNFATSAGALTGAWYVTGKIKPGFETHYKANYGEPGTLPGAAVHYDLAGILCATKADKPSALVKEVLEGRWDSKALSEITPSSGKEDRALDVGLTAMHYSNEGVAMEGVR